MTEGALNERSSFFINKGPCGSFSGIIGHDQIRDNGPQKTHIIVNYFFLNITPDVIGYKPNAPGYLYQEKQDMTRLETMSIYNPHIF